MRPAAHRATSPLVSRAALVLAACLIAQSAAAQTRPAKDDDDDDDAPRAVGELVVTARRLDAARASIEPSLGASTYAVSNAVVENRPGGESANLVHVLLQMPGVVQGASGELSVRAQTGLQYRINNVIVPDGFNDLADTLRARFADNVQLVTGALPAQYGLQVGGVVNVTTKNGVYEHGGEVEAYAGSHGRAETAFEGAGSVGNTNLYASGSYLHDDVGLGALDGATRPRHDRTDQFDAFTFVDHIVDAQSRLSLIAGLSSDRNQLPDPPGIAAGDQRNRTAYALVSYQRSMERLTVQASASLRYSTLDITAAPNGGPVFAAVVEDVANRTTSAGLQLQGVYELSAAHRLRAGLVASANRGSGDAAYGTGASRLLASGHDHRRQASVFAEDEWRPATALTVNFGVRFDHVSGAGGGARMSPRLNAVWEPVSGAAVHAGYARYFVPAPERDEAGWPEVVGGLAPPPANHESDPRAETDDYFDIGVQQSIEDLKLGVDAYWREATDLIDEVRVGSTLLGRPFNYARGRVRGVEFNATYAEGPITAWANLTLARSEGRGIVSGQTSFTAAELAATQGRFVRTTNDQPVTASLGATYHWRALRLSADGIYGSGLPRTVAGGAPDAAHLPAYAQVNLSAVYRLEGLRDRPLDLRVEATNVFDRKYQLRDGASLAGGLPQWGPRAGVLVGFEQQF